MVVVTVSKKQVDMLLRVLPCSAAVCYALPVQLKWVGGEGKGFKVSHLLFKLSSVNKMLVGVGKQTVLLVKICWQRTIKQSHWVMHTSQWLTTHDSQALELLLAKHHLECDTRRHDLKLYFYCINLIDRKEVCSCAQCVQSCSNAQTCTL